MSTTQLKICVYGSSSKTTPKLYLDHAYRLGEIIAEKNYICVNGGGKFGCMGALSEGCHSKKGKVIGVIHEKWIVDGEEHKLVDMVVCSGEDLSERKQLLLDHGDCVIVLPVIFK